MDISHIFKTRCIIADIFSTKCHLFQSLSFSVQIILTFVINCGQKCQYQPSQIRLKPTDLTWVIILAVGEIRIAADVH